MKPALSLFVLLITSLTANTAFAHMNGGDVYCRVNPDAPGQFALA